MADIREIHKEKIIYKDGGQGSGRPARAREEIHEHFHDHYEERRDHRTRRIVRGEILSFRRGVYLILDIIQVLLIARFFVELFGFPLTNPVADIIRLVTYPLLAPFGNILTYVTPTFILNWSILFAMVAYGLLAYMLMALFESGIRAAYRR